jgi:hypothetical protein
MPDLAPAAELRAAATALRSEPDLLLRVSGLQLARWLEQAADAFEGIEVPDDEPALATARAILAGGQP